MSTTLKGKLLVATPPLVDPNFDRTVVLMLEHTDEGSLGLVLNRPTDEEVALVLPGWQSLVTGTPVLFGGGPVETDSIIGLAWMAGEPRDDWAQVGAEGLGTIDLTVEPEQLAGRVSELRMFRGYAGWGPGQLEGELDANAWIVVDAERRDAFSDDPGELWRAVLSRQGGRLSWIGRYFPDDLATN